MIAPPSQPRRQAPPWPWLLIVVAALAAGIGLRDPSPPDEPRFVLAAQHMVESGDWLVPRRGSEAYSEKPPVFMWLQAASYLVVRDWRVAFLLPSLLAALGTLWLTWDLAARLWGTRFAPYAAGALWICVQFGLQAHRGQIDMVLVFLTTLSVWALARHLLLGPAWRWAWLGGFAAGVGTVTKGVGFLPLLLLIPWAFVRRDLP
jgi:4-amino-4-deoxy-L-arabinose transferase-like glycosyltransferase